VSREKRLAELILSRAQLVAEEKERRRQFADTIKTFDADIAKYAADIQSGQKDLFLDDEEALS